jgi:hypothetical protein
MSNVHLSGRVGYSPHALKSENITHHIDKCYDLRVFDPTNPTTPSEPVALVGAGTTWTVAVHVTGRQPGWDNDRRGQPRTDDCDRAPIIACAITAMTGLLTKR